MLNQTVSNNFAEALFNVKNYNADDLYKDFLDFKEKEKINPMCKDILCSDFISENSKKKYLYTNFINFQKYSKYFDIVFNLKKSNYISSIIDCFIKKYREKNNIGVIELVSSVDFSEHDLNKTVEKIKNNLKFKDVIVKKKIDKSIIAGFLVYVNDYILDFSIKGFLNNFKKKLDIK